LFEKIIDGQVELVAGAFSSFPEKSLRKGEELFLNRDRIYKSYKEMVEKESSMPEEERIDFVTIVTPNNTHFEIAKAFILEGFNVFCEKPMVLTIKEADELLKLVKETDIVFAVAYNYACYPMVKQARELANSNSASSFYLILNQAQEYSFLPLFPVNNFT
jgi:predicted dehydrogenase